MPQVSRYHPLLVVLHWFLALIIIAALALGALVMAKMPNSDPMKLEALRSHMTGGLIILVLMLVRLVTRIRSRKPPEATTHNGLLDTVAWASHRMLYVAIFGMIASGIIMAAQTNLPQVIFLHQGHLPKTFWAFPIRRVHYAFSRLLMGLIALHIAGALYHTFFLRDRLLRRMFFGRRFAAATANAPAGGHSRQLEVQP
jgi:cytochrome b561